MFDGSGIRSARWWCRFQKPTCWRHTIITNRTSSGIMSYSSREHSPTGVCMDEAAKKSAGRRQPGYDPFLGPITNTTLVSLPSKTPPPGQRTLTDRRSYPSPATPSRSIDPADGHHAGRQRRAYQRRGLRGWGVLFAVHNTEVSDRAAIRWYRINATNNLLLEAGTIADQTSICSFLDRANSNGVVVIGCNGSSQSTFSVATPSPDRRSTTSLRSEV